MTEADIFFAEAGKLILGLIALASVGFVAITLTAVWVIRAWVATIDARVKKLEDLTP